MKTGRWYSIHYENPNLFVAYGNSNRIISASCFLLVFFFLFVQGDELFRSVHLFQYGIVCLVSVFLLLMILLADQYRFDLEKRILVISRGVYPFRKIRIESFENITEIGITRIHTHTRNDVLFEVSLSLKDGVRKFGIFRDVGVLKTNLGEFVIEK